MIRRAYRLTTREFAQTAFSGEGARRWGGRWNNPGTAVVYAADSLSLAQLELLVRLHRADLIRQRFCCVVAELPAELVLPTDALGELPTDWAAGIPRPTTQQMGDRWVREQRSVAVEVPSAITAGEMNFLLNPGHPDFARIKVFPPADFAFDGRLFSVQPALAPQPTQSPRIPPGA